jgi:hypothetical protein
MAHIKNQFFSGGVDNEKRSDINVILERVDIEKIAKWTPEQKQSCKKWIDFLQSSFNNFIESINTGLEQDKE